MTTVTIPDKKALEQLKKIKDRLWSLKQFDSKGDIVARLVDAHYKSIFEPTPQPPITNKELEMQLEIAKLTAVNKLLCDMLMHLMVGGKTNERTSHTV